MTPTPTKLAALIAVLALALGGCASGVMTKIEGGTTSAAGAVVDAAFFGVRAVNEIGGQVLAVAGVETPLAVEEALAADGRRDDAVSAHYATARLWDVCESQLCSNADCRGLFPLEHALAACIKGDEVPVRRTAPPPPAAAFGTGGSPTVGCFVRKPDGGVRVVECP